MVVGGGYLEKKKNQQQNKTQPKHTCSHISLHSPVKHLLQKDEYVKI